jgi:hypothetical protein
VGESALISNEKILQIDSMDAKRLLKELKKTPINNEYFGVHILLLNELSKFSKGKTVEKTLLEFTESVYPVLRATAFDALLKNGHKQVIHAAIKHLDDEQKVVIRCIELLGYHNKKQIIPRLIEFLKDEREWVRFYSAINLGILLENSNKVLNVYIHQENNPVVLVGLYYGIAYQVTEDQEYIRLIDQIGQILLETENGEYKMTIIDILADLAYPEYQNNVFTIYNEFTKKETDEKIKNYITGAIQLIKNRNS